MIKKDDICILRFERDLKKSKEEINLTCALVKVCKIISNSLVEISFIEVYIDDSNGYVTWCKDYRKTMIDKNKNLYKINMRLRCIYE